MLKRLLTAAAWCLWLSANGADAATYRVGLAETGYAPFSFAKDDARVGIFLEILNAAGKASGDRFEPVFAPTVRLKEMFEKGRIDIECGIAPEWRKDQEKISAYSRPFATVEDVILSKLEWSRESFERASGAQIVVNTTSLGLHDGDILFMSPLNHRRSHSGTLCHGRS